jgi:hypothetical protein
VASPIIPTLTPASGTLPATTIEARISAQAPLGSVSGSITNTSNLASQADVDVSGGVVLIEISPANLNGCDAMNSGQPHPKGINWRS